jgi:subtilisin family serine protease
MPKTSQTGKKSKVAAKKSRERQVKGNRARTSGRTGPPARVIAAPAPKRVSLNPPKPLAAESLTVNEGVAPEVQTIIYVHGIGNKPLASVLKCQWDSALFGVQLGDRSRMAYWVNRDYYPRPSDGTCATGDLVRIDDDEVTTKAIMALAAMRPTDEQKAIENEIEALTDDARRRDWMRALSEKMIAWTSAGEGDIEERTVKATGVSQKALPLPKFLRRLITQKLTRAFLRDVNDFLFHPERLEAMQQSLVDRLNGGGGPFVIIAHSQGSMIAYNLLRQLRKEDCDVRLFLTIGSPLGLTEVQDVLREWNGGALRVPECVTRWVNVADRLDPVAADNDISNDFMPKRHIENIAHPGLNDDSPRYPHSGTGYLSSDPVRQAVRETVGNAFGQAVGKAIIVRDLAQDLEDGFRNARHATLIKLVTPEKPGPRGQTNLTEVRNELTKYIEKMVADSGENVDDVQLEPMKRYVSVHLTRLEIERLRALFQDLQIERVWRDAVKKALISQSTNTVQARPANLGYGAMGRGVGWAVLDTGIRADHPHFAQYKNVVAQWDCTKHGKPVKLSRDESARLDQNGHGTHVAGIIAGTYECPAEDSGQPSVFSGMAPEAKLYGFKVLTDQGNGQDSYIIKALDRIADLNEEAGKLVIHGVNLSLGGSFDQGVYGCGHTPLCEELRRLWGQGVLVCLAAGNEGYVVLRTMEGDSPSNLDLSIGDPANLEEAIAVGSIHKSNPHTYGVSYFSSRGPTADGRVKPDLVAPGEQILSAYHEYDHQKPPSKRKASELYIEMSGTSMACPHVSGLLAAFLSVRREFIGYPDLVKTRLLENCTDLKRDAYAQGRGMPNLIRMLTNS